jgi:hypothetical protein
LRTSNSAPFSSIFLHIGEKIKRTLAWPGHNHHRERPLPFRGHPHETPICHLLAMAEVKEWNQFQCIWVPRDPTFWNLGQCRVVVGVRRGSQTIVQQDGFRSQLIPCSDALRSKLKELGRNGCLPVCSKGHRRLNLSILTERARRMQYHHAGLSIPTRIRRSRAWRPPIKWPALAGVTSIAPHLRQRRRALNAKTIHRRR